MFTDENGVRLTRPLLERVLHHMCVLLGIDPDTHSWHSFRIYLAVALKEAGADNQRIKAMLRWCSDKSLEIYARDNAHQYVSWLRKAEQAEVHAVYTHTMPEIDDDEAVATLSRVLAAGNIE